MAGSLNHICGEEGFTMGFIENLGDAHEALEECYNLILLLAGGDMNRIQLACAALGYPIPTEPMTFPRRFL